MTVSDFCAAKVGKADASKLSQSPTRVLDDTAGHDFYFLLKAYKKYRMAFLKIFVVAREPAPMVDLPR